VSKGQAVDVPEKSLEKSWTAVRGRLLWFEGNPFQQSASDCVRYEADGLILMKDGKIVACGATSDISSQVPESVTIDHYCESIIMPGFVDAHVHYPQVQIMGAHGKQLLEWLNKYTFVAEEMYADPDHAKVNARFFCDELLRNGTTTAATFCTVHPSSVDAIFSAASQRNMGMIAGKVMMDRNAPEALLDTPEIAYAQSSALIKKWHGKGRNLYALTPRFAPCCTPEQLAVAQVLRGEFPDVYVQSHLCENLAEIAWVDELFPHHDSYLQFMTITALQGHGAFTAMVFT